MAPLSSPAFQSCFPVLQRVISSTHGKMSGSDDKTCSTPSLCGCAGQAAVEIMIPLTSSTVSSSCEPVTTEASSTERSTSDPVETSSFPETSSVESSAAVTSSSPVLTSSVESSLVQAPSSLAATSCAESSSFAEPHPLRFPSCKTARRRRLDGGEMGVR